MNTILGGMFQARLNANIREEKGYSYGVGSGFGFGKGPEPFRTGGDIVGDKTDAALIEFMKELRGILGDRPGDRRGAADGQGIARPAAARHVRIGRRDQRRHHRIVGARAARQLLSAVCESGHGRSPRTMSCGWRRNIIDLDHLAIVIVGDRKAIEEPLRATKIAPIAHLDIEGAALVNGP